MCKSSIGEVVGFRGVTVEVGSLTAASGPSPLLICGGGSRLGTSVDEDIIEKYRRGVTVGVGSLAAAPGPTPPGPRVSKGTLPLVAPPHSSLKSEGYPLL